MPPAPMTTKVEDSVAQINSEVAVGENLDFQRKWWRFEHAVWILFTLILVLDLAGFFGRGPVAYARISTPDGAMAIKYERIERTGTPSILDINFGPSAIRNGNVQLYVSESIVDSLGSQRIIPSPATTIVGDGGLTYTFPATTPPAAVQFALQPSAPGIYHFKLEVPGSRPVEASVLVVP
jgi:hypothetical protein